jgi:hypothetical protein
VSNAITEKVAAREGQDDQETRKHAEDHQVSRGTIASVAPQP